MNRDIWLVSSHSESWRVPHVGQEMLTLSETSDFTHSLYIHYWICQSHDYAYGLMTLDCVPGLVSLLCLGPILFIYKKATWLACHIWVCQTCLTVTQISQDIALLHCILRGCTLLCDIHIMAWQILVLQWLSKSSWSRGKALSLGRLLSLLIHCRDACHRSSFIAVTPAISPHSLPWRLLSLLIHCRDACYLSSFIAVTPAISPHSLPWRLLSLLIHCRDACYLSSFIAVTPAISPHSLPWRLPSLLIHCRDACYLSSFIAVTPAISPHSLPWRLPSLLIHCRDHWLTQFSPQLTWPKT